MGTINPTIPNVGDQNATADPAIRAAINTILAEFNGNVDNNNLKSSAGISHSKLANSTAGHLLIANGSGVITGTAITGDVTISSSGVTDIGDNKVVTSTIADSNVTSPKLGLTTGGSQLGVSSSPISSGQAAGGPSVDNIPVPRSNMLLAVWASFDVTLDSVSGVAGNADGRIYINGGEQTTYAKFHSDLSGNSLRTTITNFWFVSVSAEVDLSSALVCTSGGFFVLNAESTKINYVLLG